MLMHLTSIFFVNSKEYQHFYRNANEEKLCPCWATIFNKINIVPM